MFFSKIKNKHKITFKGKNSFGKTNLKCPGEKLIIEKSLSDNGNTERGRRSLGSETGEARAERIIWHRSQIRGGLRNRAD